MNALLPDSADSWAGLTGALQADLPGALVVAVCISALFLAAELGRRRLGLPTELTRKAVHLGGGAVVLAMPWLVQQTLTVALLCLAFLGLLVGGRLSGQLDSVHGVTRRTSGAYYYPFAVLGTWWLADGDPLRFGVPMAIMALADTGAALVGKHAGQRRYAVLDGHRSVEGSLTFFGLAFSVTLAALSAAGVPGWPETLLVALVVAIATTATEAISVRGADNLLIPYAAFLILDRTLSLGLRDLSGWLEGMLLGLALVTLSWRRGGLTEAAGIAVFLVTAIAWALGGLPWLLPLLALYAGLVGLGASRTLGRLDLDEVIPTCLGALVVVLAFGHRPDAGLYVPYLAALGASGAIAMARLAAARRWPRAPAVLLGITIPVLPALAMGGGALPPAPIATASLVGLLVFAVLARTPLAGRRLLAALAASGVAWALV